MPCTAATASVWSANEMRRGSASANASAMLAALCESINSAFRGSSVKRSAPHFHTSRAETRRGKKKGVTSRFGRNTLALT